METILKPCEPVFYVCRKCQRRLPADAFYTHRLTLLPDCYCKECRREASRRQRKKHHVERLFDPRMPYPVITRTADPALRRELLLAAIAKVRESVRRKQMRLLEKEAEGG